MKVRAEIDFDILNGFCIDDFDGNEYLIGCGFIHNETHIILDDGDRYPIKKDTRAIHFEDMLDSQGNKIFASLSEDGKGGDIIEIDNTELTRTAMYKNVKFILEENIDIVNKYLIFKVIGIQK